MGLGEFYSIICAVIWALAVVLFKRSGETLEPFDLNLFKNILTLVVLIPLIAIIDGWQLHHYQLDEWTILLISGFLGIGLSDSFYFRALNQLGASRMGIVASLYSPFVILLSILFLGERLNVWQFTGFLLVLVGVLLVSYRRRQREVDQEHLLKGLAIGVLAVFLNAVTVIMVKPVLETAPFFTSVWIRILAGAVGVACILQARGSLTGVFGRYRQHHQWPTTVTASLLGGCISMAFWLAGYKYTDASIAAVLNETASVFIVIFAWLILGELLTRRKIAGVMLTFTGVAIMLIR